MDLFTQELTDGLLSGCIYGSLALAIVLIFRVSGVVNFAQGSMALVGTYLAWQFGSWGWTVFAAALAALACSFVIGYITHYGLIRRIQTSNDFGFIIVTIGLFIALSDATGLVWGYSPHGIPSLVTIRPIRLGTLVVTGGDIVILAALIVEVVLLWVLLRHTRYGLAMRACASNQTSAKLVGIPVLRMQAVVWGISGILGSIAGILSAPSLYIAPGALFTVFIYALAGAALGGFDSLVGAVVGGIIIGISENLAGVYISWIGNDLQIAVPLAIIVVVLVLKPNGLLGSRSVVRV